MNGRLDYKRNLFFVVFSNFMIMLKVIDQFYLKNVFLHISIEKKKQNLICNNNLLTFTIETW